MGIPTYFAHLIKEYPDIIKNCLDLDIGRIFLDLNCAIHPCCREIIEKYKGKDIPNDLLEKEMIDNVIQYIDKIVLFSNPKNLTYISIDGVAPRAKVSQQRLRRFKSIKEKKYINEIKSECGKEINHTWDTNAITPGTTFMSKLSIYIKKYISETDTIKSNIIFSDSNIPGEGEHKILQYIRNNKPDNNSYDIIYGLDADLIMLALTIRNNNIALLREPVHFQKDIENDEVSFLYLDINYLKLQLSNEIYNKLDNSNISLNDISENLITDYIFLCMLLGNDFLPHLPSLSIRTGGIDELLDYYSVIRNKYSKNLIDSDFTINIDFFNNLLKKILKTEDEKLKNLYNKRKHFRLSTESCADFYDEKMNEMNYYPILNLDIEDELLLGEKNWQDRYYKKCFDNIQGREYEINKICKNYYDGLNWNLKYYFEKCPSWEWYYKQRHAPSVLNLLNYIENAKFVSNPTFDSSLPHDPFTILMMVLPPDSHFLLPNNYKTLHKEITSGIAEYYPIDFQLDTVNKKYYWECYPILPDINSDKLLHVLEKYKLSISEKERNSIKNEVIITKNKKYIKLKGI